MSAEEPEVTTFKLSEFMKLMDSDSVEFKMPESGDLDAVIVKWNTYNLGEVSFACVSLHRNSDEASIFIEAKTRQAASAKVAAAKVIKPEVLSEYPTVKIPVEEWKKNFQSSYDLGIVIIPDSIGDASFESIDFKDSSTFRVSTEFPE